MKQYKIKIISPEGIGDTMDSKLLFGATALLLIVFMGFIIADGGSNALSPAGAPADCGPSGCAAHPIDENAGTNAGTTGSGSAGFGSNANAQGGAGSANAGAGNLAVQSVTLRATPSGYDKASITVKAGVPVKFDFSADPNAGCGRQIIIDRVGVNLISRSGETVSATFTPPTPGQYAYHCSMNMFRGMLIAT